MPRTSLMLALAASLASAIPASARDGRPPNVVLILADDLGWGDVGFNGRKEWATPNLDRLASQGTTFTRWYTAAVVCAPSRAALMTGKYTIHDGVSRNNDDLPASEVTIAEALKGRGYATALFGKWHHGAPRPPSKDYVHPTDQGFDEFFGFTDAKHAWEQFPKELWHGRELKPVSGYANDLFTDRAIDFLGRKKDGPFFLYLPYIATHFHIQAPDDEVALHRGKFPEADPSNPLNATYAAMVTRLDKNVGRVLAAIDRLGLDRDTIVIFSSDHGATFEEGNKGVSNFHDSNRPFRGQKRTLWEGGIRVPGVVRWPGHVPGGVVSRGIVHNTDILPTLLAAAGGVAPTRRLEGRRRRPPPRLDRRREVPRPDPLLGVADRGLRSDRRDARRPQAGHHRRDPARAVRRRGRRRRASLARRGASRRRQVARCPAQGVARDRAQPPPRPAQTSAIEGEGESVPMTPTPRR